jgi:hypothetical protein
MVKQQQRRHPWQAGTDTPGSSSVDSGMAAHQWSEQKPQMVCDVQVVDR